MTQIYSRLTGASQSVTDLIQLRVRTNSFFVTAKELWKCLTGQGSMSSVGQNKPDKFTYFPMLSGRLCKEISLMERHVKFRSSGKLSGSLEKQKRWLNVRYKLKVLPATTNFVNHTANNRCSILKRAILSLCSGYLVEHCLLTFILSIGQTITYLTGHLVKEAIQTTKSCVFVSSISVKMC